MVEVGRGVGVSVGSGVGVGGKAEVAAITTAVISGVEIGAVRQAVVHNKIINKRLSTTKNLLSFIKPPFFKVLLGFADILSQLNGGNKKFDYPKKIGYTEIPGEEKN